MVDTSIIMQAARTPDVNLPNILQRSAESAAAIEGLPLLRRQQEAKTQMAEQSAAQQQAQMQRQEQLSAQQDAIRKAKIIYGHARQLKNLPQAQRRTYLNTIDREVIADLGFDDDTFTKISTDDGSIDTMIAQIEPLIQADQKQVGARRSESLAGGRITAQELDDGTVRYLEYGQEIPQDQVQERVAAAQQEYIADQQELSRGRRGGALGAEEEFKPRIAAKTTEATESAKDVQEFVSTAVPTLNKIEANIANYDDVISAIDSGARSGAIVSRLPSVNEASKDLEVLRNKLGLDVVGMASFGALSEGELRLALDTALPTNKEPQALRQWVADKRDAQIKAAETLRDSVAFLNNGGSLADLIELGRNRRKEQQKTPANTGGASTDEFEGFEIIE